MRPKSVPCCMFLVLLFTIALLPTPSQAIETAGELFVDLDASTFTTGDETWVNAGTYANFGAVAGPIGGLIETTRAVFFNGTTDAFVGGPLDDPVEAPEGLTGFDPTRSIEVWALNPSIADEETLVSWGKRGGGDGTNMAFNYGQHGNFGAVGHWGGGGPDVGWVDNDFTFGAPEANQWHHLVYTYDEEFARVYSDGELQNEEDMQQWGGLNTHFEPAIAIASQWEADGFTLTPGLKGSLAIGRVRIHDEVLTDTQILANYNEEKDGFVNPEPPEPPMPEPIPAGPLNRYSFSNPVSDDATDATITDSIGGQDGTVLGDGSSFTGSELQLDGGGSDFAAYVDLPNGLISGLTDATIEGWITIEAAQNWQRVFDIGSTEGGELDEPGGGGSGQDQWMLSAARGGNINQQRFSLKNNDPEFGGDEEGTLSDAEELLDTSVPTQLDEEYHFAAVYDSDGGSDGGPVMRVYRDGLFVDERGVTIELGNLNDVNVWLGRSNWTADQNTAGLYNEFRIFDYALTENQILGNFQAGPDLLNIARGGDYNMDGVVDAADADAQSVAMKAADPDLSIFDENGDAVVNDEDRLIWVKQHAKTWVGDSNLDHEFNSGDLVAVFAAGKYEQDEMAGWAEGDWSGDMRFSSGDLVAAFADGGYELGPPAVAAVPEPSSLGLLSLAGVGFILARRRKRQP